MIQFCFQLDLSLRLKAEDVIEHITYANWFFSINLGQLIYSLYIDLATAKSEAPIDKFIT